MRDKIKLSKSIIYDYFVLEKEDHIPFYFQKDDIDAILKRLIELKQKIEKNDRKVKICCFVCGSELLVIDSNACYCDVCNRLFTEDEIRRNCAL